MNSEKTPHQIEKVTSGITEIVKPVFVQKKKHSRNKDCYCGSGKKYKHCCINKLNELNKLDAEYQ